MSLDDRQRPDHDRDRLSADGKPPGRGRSMACLAALAVAVIMGAIFLANRPDAWRQNDPQFTAPATRP